MSDSRDHPALRYDENWPQHPVVGATGSSEPVPTAPGANGPTGYRISGNRVATTPLPVVASDVSLYEPCIATQGLSAEIPMTEEILGAAWRVAKKNAAYHVDLTVGLEFYRAMAAVAPRDAYASAIQEDYLAMTADRDAWSARCAALMTELDAVKGQLANTEGLAAMYKEAADVFHRKNDELFHRVMTVEARLAERDASLHRAVEKQ